MNKHEAENSLIAASTNSWSAAAAFVRGNSCLTRMKLNSIFIFTSGKGLFAKVDTMKITTIYPEDFYGH